MKIFSLYQLNIVNGYLQMRPENFVPPRVEGTMEHGVIDFDTRTETRTNQVDGKVVYVDIKRGKEESYMPIPLAMKIGIQKRKE